MTYIVAVGFISGGNITDKDLAMDNFSSDRTDLVVDLIDNNYTGRPIWLQDHYSHDVPYLHMNALFGDLREIQFLEMKMIFKYM